MQHSFSNRVRLSELQPKTIHYSHYLQYNFLLVAIKFQLLEEGSWNVLILECTSKK